ncbi:hypothetical protein DQ04_02141050 [Trypanosoma grayi]|uniref:hypothetical protein n=1 Tax=Trypanosoma grayi TaxID=71804 RepID=UPI0004F47D50|nr:hypothetical protein DQ04_02141050 [Trypanosoma grayi]KEG11927.1 hypothetical protein DQ04_02141050 [Trypanosoma grayi]
MDSPKKSRFSCLPSSESLTSPAGPPLNPGSFSSCSDVGKASKTEDTFIVGEYHLSSCPICLERFTLDNPAILVVCGHGFHLQCLEEWRQRSAMCPVCMKPLRGEGVPMMSARETRRRRRYKGGATSACVQQQGPECEGLCVMDAKSAPLRCAVTPSEEHIVGDGAAWSVLRVLRTVSRWCSRSTE